MFLTTAHTTVSMNAASCRSLAPDRHGAREGPFPINRGVAYLDGRVYRGMPAVAVALDATNGKPAWDVQVANGASESS